MSLVVINNVVADCLTSAHHLIYSGVRTCGAVPHRNIRGLSQEFLIHAALILVRRMVLSLHFITAQAENKSTASDLKLTC